MVPYGYIEHSITCENCFTAIRQAGCINSMYRSPATSKDFNVIVHVQCLIGDKKQSYIVNNNVIPLRYIRSHGLAALMYHNRSDIQRIVCA